MKTISSEQAIHQIIQGKKLINFYILDTLDLRGISPELEYEIHLENCKIAELYAPSVEFKRPVSWINSQFVNTSLLGAYFIQGITIDNCIFDTYLDFEAGGHNKKPVIIENTEFRGFVNFFDCWYQDEIIVRHNIFQKGTNLYGNREESIQTEFDIPPVIENNVGRMDHDDRGDREENTIWLWTPPDKPSLE